MAENFTHIIGYDARDFCSALIEYEATRLRFRKAAAECSTNCRNVQDARNAYIDAERDLDAAFTRLKAVVGHG